MKEEAGRASATHVSPSPAPSGLYEHPLLPLPAGAVSAQGPGPPGSAVDKQAGVTCDGNHQGRESKRGRRGSG